MASQEPQCSASTNAARCDDARAAANHALALVAERELLDALTQQVPPARGMYAYQSPGEAAAFDRAMRAICHEAHHLDLRAEELVIAIKKGWAQLGAMRASRLAERDGDVLREVVSSSIELFFESRHDDERRVQR